MIYCRLNLLAKLIYIYTYIYVCVFITSLRQGSAPLDFLGEGSASVVEGAILGRWKYLVPWFISPAAQGAVGKMVGFYPTLGDLTSETWEFILKNGDIWDLPSQQT